MPCMNRNDSRKRRLHDEATTNKSIFYVYEFALDTSMTADTTTG